MPTRGPIEDKRLREMVKQEIAGNAFTRQAMEERSLDFVPAISIGNKSANHRGRSESNRDEIFDLKSKKEVLQLEYSYPGYEGGYVFFLLYRMIEEGKEEIANKIKNYIKLHGLVLEPGDLEKAEGLHENIRKKAEEEARRKEKNLTTFTAIINIFETEILKEIEIKDGEYPPMAIEFSEILTDAHGGYIPGEKIEPIELRPIRFNFRRVERFDREYHENPYIGVRTPGELKVYYKLNKVEV